MSVESLSRKPDVLDFTNAIQEENLEPRQKNRLHLELVASPTRSNRRASVHGDASVAKGQASVVSKAASNYSNGSEYSRMSAAQQRRQYLTKRIKISSLKRNIKLVDLGMDPYEVYRFRRHEKA